MNAELPPEQVIAWLRTAEGKQWSRLRIGRTLESHNARSGVFASVLRDGGAHSRASWPEPADRWQDLDLTEYQD